MLRTHRRGRRGSALPPSSHAPPSVCVPTTVPTTGKASGSEPSKEVAVLAAVSSATLTGVDGQPVTVEVHVSSGLPAYQVVGLPDTAVRESRERVRAAVLSSGLEWPMQRITVNLAPGGVRKTGLGPRARGRARGARGERAAPRGSARRRRGARRARPRRFGARGARHARAGRRAARAGRTAVVVPLANAAEAELVGDVHVRSGALPRRAARVPQGRGALARLGPAPVVDAAPTDLDGRRRPRRPRRGARPRVRPQRARDRGRGRAPPADVGAAGHGQDDAGPPAGHDPRRRSSRPRRSRSRASTRRRASRSAGGCRTTGRSGHRTTPRPPRRSSVAAAGGRGRARSRSRTAGCSSSTSSASSRRARSTRCASRSRSAWCASRAQAVSLTFPASFQLVACTNPCPCGREPPTCCCSEPAKARYRRRLSAPLVDRFDLRIAVSAPLPDDRPGESSADVRQRVIAAVERQRARYADWPWSLNAHVPAGAVARLVPLDDDAESEWHHLIAERMLTGRGAARVLRVARTLADLADAPTVTAEHLRHRRDACARTCRERADPAAAGAARPRPGGGRHPRLPARHDPESAARARSTRSATRCARSTRCCGLGSPTCCARSPARSCTTRSNRSRGCGRRSARDERLPALLARRGTHVFVGRPARLAVPRDARRARGAARRGRRARRVPAPRVAVVGTRAATPHGLADARELGAYLAEGGCTVVSGLAIGIDGAAHEGALDAGGTVVGVVGTGLDVVYPRRHRALFERVRGQGLLVSELGYGVGPRKAAFPIRNRIIAGLDRRRRGGGGHRTRRRAHHRRQGDRLRAHGVRDARLATQPRVGGHQPAALRRRAAARRAERHRGRARTQRRCARAPPGPPGGDAGRVLRACGGEPATLDELASRTGFAVPALAGIVRALERDGWITRKDGLYWPMT